MGRIQKWLIIKIDINDGSVFMGKDLLEPNVAEKIKHVPEVLKAINDALEKKAIDNLLQKPEDSEKKKD